MSTFGWDQRKSGIGLGRPRGGGGDEAEGGGTRGKEGWEEAFERFDFEARHLFNYSTLTSFSGSVRLSHTVSGSSPLVWLGEDGAAASNASPGGNTGVERILTGAEGYGPWAPLLFLPAVASWLNGSGIGHWSPPFFGEVPLGPAGRKAGKAATESNGAIPFPPPAFSLLAAFSSLSCFRTGCCRYPPWPPKETG